MKLAKTGAVLSTAVVLGLGVGGCGDGETHTAPDALQQQATAEFDKNIAYWKTREDYAPNVGALATTRIIILSGNNTFGCGDDEYTSASLTMSYCESANSVVVPAFVLNEMGTTSIGFTTANTYHIAHEVSHAVRSAQGATIPNESDVEARREEELKVDCYVGMYLLGTKHEQGTFTAIGTYMHNQVTDELHGPNAGRVAALMQGGTGPESCPK